MPYTSNFIQTTLEGEFRNPGKLEEWRTGFKIPVTGTTPSDAALLNWAEDVAGVVSNFFGYSDVKAGSTAKLISVATALIGVDGKYLGGGSQSTKRYVLPVPIPGAGTTQCPLSQALCVTFKTSIERGRASRGRMYFPATALTVDPNGLIPTALCTSISAYAKNIFDALNGAATALFGGGALKIAVMSKLGEGTTAYVTDVGVGQKMDRQERREKSYSEQHVYNALAGATTAREKASRDWRAALA